MSATLTGYARLSDSELLREVKHLAVAERSATARLIACLAETDGRRLYLGEGCASLFTYCTQVLRLSEHAAYGRIQAARVARRFPCVLDLLEEGTLTMTTVGLLAPHLTRENHVAVLAAARHQSKREVERQVAALRPQPDVPTVVRKLPTPSLHFEVPTGVNKTIVPRESRVCPPPPRLTAAVVAPLAPERFKVQFTISCETHDKLRRVQDLMRHQVPSGDPATVFDRALTLLLTHLEKARMAAVRRPRASLPAARHTRTIPAATRRAVWTRDGGRCAFVGAAGRCTETGFLEFHHVVPFAHGGLTSSDNLELRCRAHNAFEAELVFGDGQLFEGACLRTLRLSSRWSSFPGARWTTWWRRPRAAGAAPATHAAFRSKR